MTTSDRDQRLAAKLRENLRRRKAQAKARAEHETGDDARGTDDNDTPTGKEPRDASR